LSNEVVVLPAEREWDNRNSAPIPPTNPNEARSQQSAMLAQPHLF